MSWSENGICGKNDPLTGSCQSTHSPYMVAKIILIIPTHSRTLLGNDHIEKTTLKVD